METDKDHIHYMIEAEPYINLSDLVRTVKSYTAYHIWKEYHNYLSKCFWKEHIFGRMDIMFVQLKMFGNVSEKILNE